MNLLQNPEILNKFLFETPIFPHEFSANGF
jgi:hypothetical protein